MAEGAELNQGRYVDGILRVVPTFAAAGAIVCTLCLGAGPAVASGNGASKGGGPTGGGGSSTSFTVSLAKTTVAVDNWSSYTQSQLSPLVQYADRGMATADPLHKRVAGEMENGDRVVITQYGIYWLDIVRRGGLLSGVWPIVSTANGPNFQYMPSGNEWEPNSLLPGATANNSAIYDLGQGLNVLATGGVDGSCTAGVGTFVIGNSDNCGMAEGPLTSSFTTSTSGADHLYTFSGTLYQEGTAHDTVMVDAAGDQAQMNFSLTYDFHDYTDTATDYGTGNGPADQRVLTHLTLTPTAPIDLSTLVVAGTSDQGGASYPYRAYDYSNVGRTYYYPSSSTPCGPTTLAADTVGAVCEGSPAPNQWISEPNTLPTTLSEGDFVTEKQTSTVGDTTDRELTVMLPLTSAYRLPERIDHIWNEGLDVSSLDVDYFNGENVSVAAGASLDLGFDMQTVPHP